MIRRISRDLIRMYLDEIGVTTRIDEDGDLVSVLKADETKDDEGDKDDETEEKTKSSLNTTLLWTYITSIAIAVVLIAVIVAWLIRKYRRPKSAAAADAKKADYDRTNKKSDKEETVTKTGSARDEFKD